MDGARREELRRVYLRLGLGELAAAALFAVVAALSVVARLRGVEVLALWGALVPLLVVLVQGGVYWLAARGWVGRAVMPPGWVLVYRAARAGDVALLAAGLVSLVVWWPDRLGAGLLVVGVWVFGVVEYVNYFMVRLSYPWRQWRYRVWRWRTPRLVIDMHAARRASRRRATALGVAAAAAVLRGRLGRLRTSTGTFRRR
ncbi:MAG: hypothetical protein ACRC35_00960 [Angustibacter sp.]